MSGCLSTNITAPVVQDRPDVIHPPLPDAVQAGNVQWKVLDAERLKALADSVDENDPRFVIFVITSDGTLKNSSDGYEQLALTINDLKRYIQEQQEIIVYYRELFPE